MPHFTTSDGTSIHYEDRAGSGDVVVLVHGYTGSMGDWDETAPRLPADWRVVRVDLRGAGASSHAESGYTIKHYAEDVFELTQGIGLPPFVLVGHSMGGATAAQFALDHPDALRGVLLLAPATLSGITPPPPEMIEQMAAIRGNIEVMKQFAAFSFTRQLDDAIVERGIRNSLKISDGHRKQSLDAMVSLRLYDRLPSLQVPTLFVGGDRDNLVPIGTVLDAFRLVPNAHLQVFTRVGHMVQQEVPDEFAALLADFVRTSARPAAAPA